MDEAKEQEEEEVTYIHRWVLTKTVIKKSNKNEKEAQKVLILSIQQSCPDIKIRRWRRQER